MINKVEIQRCFDRASHQYQHANRLQMEVAESLLQRLPAGIHPTLLDLGCGPGVNRQALQMRCQHYIGLDLSAAMLSQASDGVADANTSWLQADLESIGLADNSVDALYSNLAIQWAHNPLTAVEELLRVVRPGAPLVISTVLDGSLEPLTRLRSELTGQHGSNPQLTDANWRALLASLSTSASSIAQWSFEQQTYSIYSPTLPALLDGIKGIGATASSGPRVSLSGWRTIAKRYEQHRETQGLPLRYNIGFIHLYKKS